MVTPLSAWLPDRPPTWADVAIAVLAVAWFAFDLASLETVSWTWAAVGFVVFALGAGPVAKSFVGRRVGRWFRDIGAAGRAVAIILFAVGVWATKSAVDVPTAPVTGFASGIMLAVPLFVLLHVLHSGGVSGWRSA